MRSRASRHFRRTTCFRASSNMKASITGFLVAALCVACDNNPIAPAVDSQLNIAADSISVNLFTSVAVGAVNNSTLGALQYVSRDGNVATVNALGVVTGLATGSTYVVASLSSDANVRDSVRVRVYSDSCGGARP